MAEPTKEELIACIADLEKQVGAKKTKGIEFKRGEKGGVSVYEFVGFYAAGISEEGFRVVFIHFLFLAIVVRF
jgi:hypothetical protein